MTGVAGALAALRKSAGFTQEGLEEASGVSRRTIQDIERGISSPSVSTLELLAQAMGTTLQAFFGEDSKNLSESDKPSIDDVMVLLKAYEKATRSARDQALDLLLMSAAAVDAIVDQAAQSHKPTKPKLSSGDP